MLRIRDSAQFWSESKILGIGFTWQTLWITKRHYNVILGSMRLPPRYLIIVRGFVTVIILIASRPLVIQPQDRPGVSHFTLYLKFYNSHPLRVNVNKEVSLLNYTLTFPCLQGFIERLLSFLVSWVISKIFQKFIQFLLGLSIYIFPLLFFLQCLQ